MFNSTHRHNLFRAAQMKAKINNCQLLISHPSDLSQIEGSYFFNNQDLQLLLHIPMAPSDSILRFFQLHLFLLLFTKKHFLLPKSSNQIFAISSGMDRLSTKLSMVNLMDCHKVNSMHLCEEHGVLKKSLNSTCVGSLYLQDFAAATALCDMDIVARKETVLQLQENWYLVHCSKAYTSTSLARIFPTPRSF
jgi:hypothetical protein